ncbi:glycosyltransferase [Fundidesulfovibrio terrae]|uniref:glycosyltransferase n=1 Tax=Fundidesulfovibrio terrae TaxID=2922866 RepID=UPI001FAEE559|nr:glycosyltransferase [Fundidesulfovibrio terrae]
MRVSLIVTVKNEASSMGAFLDSVAAQTRLPDELVIVDGGSTDGTLEIIRAHPLDVLLESTPCNIAGGRNRAISLASGEVIAVTDAGCLLDPGWLERISDLRGADVVVGGYEPVVERLFDACQYAMHNLFRSSKSIDRFAISSRSLAFRKVVWEELGGYPEWLDFSEDTWFHNKIRASRFAMRMEPSAVVRWHMRPGYRAIYRQFFLYMQGDGKARQHTRRHMIRLAAYGGGVLMFCLSLSRPLWLLPLSAGFCAYLWQPVRNFRRLGLYPLSAKAMATMLAMLVTMDCGKIFGYISGLNSSVSHPADQPRPEK